jgi:hypothetical protein
MRHTTTTAATAVLLLALTGSGGDLDPNGADWGMVQKDAYQLLIAGVRVYCPERLDTVTKELRETGEY